MYPYSADRWPARSVSSTPDLCGWIEFLAIFRFECQSSAVLHWVLVESRDVFLNKELTGASHGLCSSWGYFEGSLRAAIPKLYQRFSSNIIAKECRWTPALLSSDRRMLALVHLLAK